MLWTAEAIENLKRLALEGRSASVIAAALGAASRNVVIGKANRIGSKLSGDGRASVPGGTPAGAYRAPLAAIPHPKPVGGEQNSAPALSVEPERKGAWTFAEAEVGEMRRARFEGNLKIPPPRALGPPRGGRLPPFGLSPAHGRTHFSAHS